MSENKNDPVNENESDIEPEIESDDSISDEVVTIQELIELYPDLDCNNIVVYKKKYLDEDGREYSQKFEGIPSNKKGYIYKGTEFNMFEAEPTKIPTGFRKDKRTEKQISWIKKYICDPTRERLLENNEQYINVIKEKHKNDKSYFIHDNGSRPFLVYINCSDEDIISEGDMKSYTVSKRNTEQNLSVSIYKCDNDQYFIADNDINNDQLQNKWMYIQLVKTYNVEKIFIGKSPLIKMTDYSGGHGTDFAGNSILLQLRDNKYVYVGSNVYKFKTGDIITEYYSAVGNNDVPYPIAIGEEAAYFMLDQDYVLLEKINELGIDLTDGEPGIDHPSEIKPDLYSFYYGHNNGYPAFKKYTIKMKSLKIINNREW